MPSLGALPSWAEGETLYSWACKTHLLLARSSRWSSMALFGSLRASRAHAFPTHVPHFAGVVGNRLGSIEDTLRDRTILGAHLSYLDRVRRVALLELVLTRNDARPTVMLGLQASKMATAHPPRFCKSCQTHDRQWLGYARWKIAHQLPGAWVCLEHCEPLIEIERPTAAWEMPGDRPDGVMRSAGSAEVSALLRVAAVSNTAFGLREIDLEGLRRASLRRLCEIEVVANPSRLSDIALEKAFSASDIGCWIAGQQDLSSLTCGGGWVVQTLRRKRTRNPLKWAVIWSWLWQSESPECATQSFRAAAAGQQVHLGQMELWAPEDATTQSCIRRVTEAMSCSEDLEEVRRLVGVRHHVLTRWFREQPQLRSYWEHQLSARRHALAVGSVQDFIERTDGVTKQQLMDERSRDVRWLQRRDPDALDALLARVPSSRAPQRKLFPST